jgi:ATP-binding cassette, subfamily B (MDR/TAP), member 1
MFEKLSLMTIPSMFDFLVSLYCFQLFRYYKALEDGKKVGILKNVWVGVGMGTTFGLMFCNYALAFYVGTNFVADGDIEPKTLLTVFFSIMMGSMALGQASQQFAVVGTAQGAAADIFEVIDRVSIYFRFRMTTLYSTPVGDLR